MVRCLDRKPRALVWPLASMLGLAAACGVDLVGTTQEDPAASSSSSGSGSSSGNSSSSSGQVAEGGVGAEGGVAQDGGGGGGDGATPPGSTITISVSNTTNAINLSNEGPIDWIYWGHSGAVASVVRKANGDQIASTYSVTGATPGVSNAQWPVVQSWNNGTSPASGSSSFYTYCTGSDNAAMTFNVKPASTTRTLTLIVAQQDVATMIEASFNDGSATATSPQDSNGVSRHLRIAVTFRSTTATTLSVRYRIVSRYNMNADTAITMTSASLK